MQRVTRASAVPILPAPPASPGTPGFFTAGSPAAGQPATVPGAEWFNGVQEELIALIHRGGITPAANDLAQVRKSLDRVFGGGARAVTANVTLTADDAGLVLVDASAGPVTLTLPAAAAAAARPIRITVVRTDTTAHAVTLASAGSDLIEGAATFALARSARVSLWSDGGAAWRVVAEAAAGRSLASPGWARLPGGLILQWVRNLVVTANGNGDATAVWTYPVAFPSAVLGYAYCPTDEVTALNTTRAVAGAPSLTSQAIFLNTNLGSGQVAVSGFALGI